LPPADHLLIERDRGQFVPSRRRRRMANVGVERLLKIPGRTQPRLRIPGAAAQTRVVSLAGIRPGSWESARAFKGIICDDISEFESYMPSQAVRSLGGISGLEKCFRHLARPKPRNAMRHRQMSLWKSLRPSGHRDTSLRELIAALCFVGIGIVFWTAVVLAFVG
jgi:hypothetical protein